MVTIVLDDRFKEKDINEIKKLFDDFDNANTIKLSPNIELKSLDVGLKYINEDNQFFISFDKNNYSINNLNLTIEKNQYTIQKSKKANHSLVSINEDSMYILNSNNDKELLFLQYALKIISDYAKENKIDKKLDINYVSGQNESINEFIPIFTGYFKNKEVLKSPKNIEIANKIPKTANEKNISNALEIYKELVFKTFLLKENFINQIIKENYQYYKGNAGIEKLSSFEQIEKGATISQNSVSLVNDIFLKYMLDKENKKEYDTLFSPELLIETLDFSEKYKSSQTYNDLKNIINNINILDTYIEKSSNSYLVNKLSNFLSNTNIQMIVAQNIQNEEYVFEEKFNKKGEIYSFGDKDDRIVHNNYINFRKKTELDILPIRVASNLKNQEEPKSFYDFSGLDKTKALEVYKLFKNAIIVSDDILNDKDPIIKKDGKYFHYQYNNFFMSDINIINKKNTYKDYENINDILLNLGSKKRSTAFDIINTTDNNKFNKYIYSINEEENVELFLKSKRAKNNIIDIIKNEKRNQIPTSIHNHKSSIYTENPKTSKELQDNIYIEESKNIFSVLKPDERKRESITFAGNGFTRNSVFPMFLSITEEQEKEKIIDIFNKATEEYVKDLTNIDEIEKQKIKDEIKEVSQKIISNKKNKQISISIKQTISDDLLIPVEFLKTINEFGQLTDELPIPSNYFYNELEKENIVNKERMLTTPKIKEEEKLLCVKKMYENGVSLIEEIGNKDLIENKIKEIDKKSYEEKIKEIKSITDEYCEKIYNFADFDSVLKTLKNEELKLANDFIEARKIDVYKKDVINIEEFEDLNERLKIRLQDKYVKYEEKLADFTKDNQLRNRMQDIIAKSIINHYELKKKFENYRTASLILQKLNNDYDFTKEIGHYKNDELIDKSIKFLKIKTIENIENIKNINDLKDAMLKTKESFLQSAFSDNFKNKFKNINGLKSHQLDTMFSSLLKPNNVINLNFSARAGKTLTSLATLLVSNKDKAEFYGQQKNIKDILWQFYYFLPDYSHKMKFKITTNNDNKYNFLPEKNKLHHFDNSGYLINIPEKLKGLLNNNISVNKDSSYIIIKKEFYNKINMIKAYLDNETKDISKYLKQTGAIELQKELNELSVKYNTKIDNSKMIDLMSMYLHSLVKEGYLLKENISEAIKKISQSYEENILQNIDNNQSSYLTIGNMGSVSKIITNEIGEEKKEQNKLRVCKYDKEQGIESLLKSNGYMVDFEDNDSILVNTDNIKRFYELSKNLLEKLDFTKDSDIKNFSNKKEIIVIPKYNRKKNNIEMFLDAIDEINIRINKNIVNEISKKIKDNNKTILTLNEEQITNYIFSIKKDFLNKSNEYYFNLNDTILNTINSEKELKLNSVVVNDFSLNNEPLTTYKLKIDDNKLEKYKEKIFDLNMIKNLLYYNLLEKDDIEEIITKETDAKKINTECFRQILGMIFIPKFNEEKGFVMMGRNLAQIFTYNDNKIELKVRYRERNTKNDNIFNSNMVVPSFASQNGKIAHFNFVKSNSSYFQPSSEIDKVIIEDAEYVLTSKEKTTTIEITKNNTIPLISKSSININEGSVIYYKEYNSKEKQIVALDEAHKNMGEEANFGKIIRKNILNNENIQPILITATPVRMEFSDLSMKQINDLALKILIALQNCSVSNRIEQAIINIFEEGNFENALYKIIHKSKISESVLIGEINRVLESSSKDEFMISDLSKKTLEQLDTECLIGQKLEKIRDYLIMAGITKYKDIDLFGIDLINRYVEDNIVATKSLIPTTQVTYANLNLENNKQYSIINSLPFEYEIINEKAQIEKNMNFIKALVSVQKYYSIFNVNNSLDTLKTTINAFREAFNSENRSKEDLEIIKDNIKEINKKLEENVIFKYSKINIKDFWSSDNITVPDDGYSIIYNLYMNYDSVKHYLEDDFTKQKDKLLSDKYKVGKFIINNYLYLALENLGLQKDAIRFNKEIFYEKSFFDGTRKKVAIHNEDKTDYGFYYSNINNILMPINIKNNSESEIKYLSSNMGFCFEKGLVYNEYDTVHPKQHIINTKINFEFDEYCFKHFFPNLSKIIDFDKMIFPSYEIKPKSYKLFEALNILYEENLREEIAKNIYGDKYFPIFTNRTPTQTMTTLFVLDTLLQKNNNKLERVVVIEDEELKLIINAIDKEKLNSANINLISCKNAEEAHNTLFNLNKLKADPKIMIFPTKKVAEGFQIQKISHDKDTYMIFTNVQECAMDLTTTCQALSRADCINAREEQKLLNGNKIFKIQAKFFGAKTEIKSFRPDLVLKNELIEIFKEGKISLKDKDLIIKEIIKGKAYLSYEEPKGAMLKLKSYTDFYQDNFRDKLTTNSDIADRTLPIVKGIIEKAEKEKIEIKLIEKIVESEDISDKIKK